MESFADDARIAAQWEYYSYATIERHWHSLWCRWKADGSPVAAFNAERIIKPDGDGGAVQHNIYHFEDERGTVAEGPLCGPWHLTKLCCTPHGIVHPSRDSMVMLHLPGGDLGWVSKEISKDQPTAGELFLHHDKHLRMSVGIVYGADCQVQTLALIREDARGPWPSVDWSSSQEAFPINHQELLEFLESHGTPFELNGFGDVISADLTHTKLDNIKLCQSRLALAGPEDAILLCSDKKVAIVAPKTVGGALSFAAAWWPTASIMYSIEIAWDAEGALEAVRRFTFHCK